MYNFHCYYFISDNLLPITITCPNFDNDCVSTLIKTSILINNKSLPLSINQNNSRIIGQVKRQNCCIGQELLKPSYIGISLHNKLKKSTKLEIKKKDLKAISKKLINNKKSTVRNKVKKNFNFTYPSVPIKTIEELIQFNDNLNDKYFINQMVCYFCLN